MYSRTNAYDNFMRDLNAHLLPKFISGTDCDIFPESIAKIAGVESTPDLCEMTSVKDDDTALCLTINGITMDEAAKLNRFLLKPDADDSSPAFSETESLHDDSDEEIFKVNKVEEKVKVTFQFIITIEEAHKKLLPIFAYDLDFMSEADLEIYQTLSANNLEVLLYKLDYLFNEIMRLTIELQSSAIADYMKGQLEVLLDELVYPTLRLYHTNLKGHDCPPAMMLVEATKNNFKMYERKFAETEGFSNKPLASELKDDITDYLASAEKIASIKTSQREATLLKLMGIFGAQSQSANANRNIPADDILNSLLDKDSVLESVFSNLRK